MISAEVSKKVLVIGPDYKNHRGGIGALLDVYRNHYEVFNFIPSFRNLPGNTQKIWFFFRQLVKIVSYLSNNKEVEIIHLHSAKDGSLYRKLIIAFVAKKMFGKKVINHIHTGHFQHFYEESSWFTKKNIKYYLRLCDLTFTVSDFWKCYFKDYFHLQNVYKLNNIVGLGGSCEPIRVTEITSFLFLGVISKAKGIFDLVNVIAENKKRLKNKMKLIVCGSGDTDLLRSLIKQHDLEDLIEFKGWIIGVEKEALLKSADVYILPSYYEGVPISILEAMSFGKPIISTTVGGIPEVVESNTNGLLINPGDSHALLNALLFYINDRNNVITHGSQSLLKVKDYYPEAITQQLESFYTRLMN